MDERDQRNRRNQIGKGRATPEALLDEEKRLRRLRFLVDLTASVLYQDDGMRIDEAYPSALGKSDRVALC